MPDPKTGTLAIHVGDHKSESTEIQTELAAKRLSVPKTSLFYPDAAAQAALYDDWKRDDTPFEDTALGTLSASIRRAAADVTLMSGEWLEDAPAPFMRSILDSHLAATCDDYKIVTYLRPHAARFLATGTDQIKFGLFQGDTLDQYHVRSFENKRFIYTPRYTDWKTAFGDKFIVRPLIETRLFGGDIVKDFIKTATGQDDFTLAQTAPPHTAMGLRDLMILKLIHRRNKPLTRADHIGLGRSISHHLGDAAEDAHEPLRLHKSLAETIARSYRADARTVDTLVFGGERILEDALDCAIDTAASHPQSLRPADHLSADERRTVLALADMISEISGNGTKWNAHFRKTRPVAGARA